MNNHNSNKSFHNSEKFKCLTVDTTRSPINHRSKMFDDTSLSRKVPIEPLRQYKWLVPYTRDKLINAPRLDKAARQTVESCHFVPEERVVGACSSEFGGSWDRKERTRRTREKVCKLVVNGEDGEPGESSPDGRSCAVDRPLVRGAECSRRRARAAWASAP